MAKDEDSVLAMAATNLTTPGTESPGQEVVQQVVVSAPVPEGMLPVARLSLLRQGEAYSFNIALSRNSPSELTQALERHLAPLSDPTLVGTPAELRWKEVLASIQSTGWAVEKTHGDIAVKIVVDGRLGKVFASYQPLHALADEDQGRNAKVVQDSLARIEEMLTRKAREHSSLVLSAIQEGRLSAIPSLLEEGEIYFQLYPQQVLLTALQEVDVGALKHEDAVAILRARVAFANNLREHAGLDRDFSHLLALTGEDKEPGSVARLLVARANAARQRSLQESAMALYRDASQAAPPSDALACAWAYRGLALSAQAGSPAQLSQEERAMAAFLSGGDPLEATNSAVAISRQRISTAPEAALSLIEKAISWHSPDEPTGKELRAALYDERAKMLFSLRRFRESRAEAEAAAELRRGLVGSERARVTALYSAALAAEQSGDAVAAKELRARASTEYEQFPGADTDLEWKFATALEEEGWPGIAQLRADVEASGNAPLQIKFLILEACSLREKSLPERLALLDNAMNLAKRQPQRVATKLSTDVAAAFAYVFESDGDLARELEWHQKVLANEPFDAHAVGRAASLLLRLERWPDAITFAETQIGRVGRKPGWLLYLGRAQLRAGRAHLAFSALREAEKLATNNAWLPEIQKLKEEALAACETPPPPVPLPPPPPTVTVDSFETALKEFASFVASEKRMSFWKQSKEGAGHDWTSKPEKLAKDLLQTFLKGQFRALIESLEEVQTGAGRIDLYLIFSGGLRVVVELKMCGGGYATSYALEGVDQLIHYLEQKGTSLGYLIVFDGRIDDYGTGLPPPGAIGSKVIVPICIDVRPKVKSPVVKSAGRRRRKPGKGA